MKNLEILNSLSQEELIEIKGGLLPYSPPWYLVGLGLAIGLEIAQTISGYNYYNSLSDDAF